MPFREFDGWRSVGPSELGGFAHVRQSDACNRIGDYC